MGESKGQRRKILFRKTAYKVLKELVILVKIKGRNLSVRIKILEGEIPLLIGRKTMEDWNMKLDSDTLYLKCG